MSIIGENSLSKIFYVSLNILKVVFKSTNDAKQQLKMKRINFIFIIIIKTEIL